MKGDFPYRELSIKNANYHFTGEWPGGLQLTSKTVTETSEKAATLVKMTTEPKRWINC